MLITGSAGWLGRHLYPLLKDAGHEIVGLDVVAGTTVDHVASVADSPAIRALFEAHQFDAVIHSGALHKPDIVRFGRQDFIDVNVTGTLNLLEGAAARPGTRFIFTSTTSLMISQKIRQEQSETAFWLDEETAPLEPRNIYGVTKLAAEGLCRLHHHQSDLNVIILRTARFFPEEDDSIKGILGLNLKANELLNRRATVSDMVRAHLLALEKAAEVKFGLYLVSAPTLFMPEDAHRLKSDARAVIDHYYPDANELFQRVNWQLPATIGRVYDGSRITRELGFEYETSFSNVLDALREGTPVPIDHDPEYQSPLSRLSSFDLLRGKMK